MHYYTGLVFLFFVEMKSPCVTQVGLELLDSMDPLVSASQNSGITGVIYHAQTALFLYFLVGFQCLAVQTH